MAAFLPASLKFPSPPPPALTPRDLAGLSHTCCISPRTRSQVGNTDKSCAHCRERHHSESHSAPCPRHVCNWTPSPEPRPSSVTALQACSWHPASPLVSTVSGSFCSLPVCLRNSGFRIHVHLNSLKAEHGCGAHCQETWLVFQVQEREAI